ncbi:MAG: LutB/LldF family L-lactate oxidation iron-sulfur protein [Thermodesulfobacteriota bacterium]
MTDSTKSIPFRASAAKAVRDRGLRAALQHATGVFTVKRADAFAGADLELWRNEASEIRVQVLSRLEDYLGRFTANATSAGAQIHRARDAAAAHDIIGSILRDHGIERVVKAKSMVSEEIHLNDYLSRIGITPVETDLGEYIIQIAGEHPSHIIVPAIHKDRRQVGTLFSEKLGCTYSEDPEALCKVAKHILREEFLSAKAGMSGANFMVADSGSIVLFSNEGNIRMCTTLPPLHIAVTSMEKIIPSLSDLPKFVRLLPRSATGQVLTSYMSVITGTRKPGEATGAQELHIVIVDNGRSLIVNSEYREMLKCIRCGACLNACPVYRTVGGHAYGSTYPGPMGIVYTALLEGMEKAHPLLDATTLCGACGDVCPVRVPLPALLRRLREERVERGLTPPSERFGMAAFGVAAKSPSLFQYGQRAAGLFWPLAVKMAGKEVLDRMPVPADRTFRGRMS